MLALLSSVGATIMFLAVELVPGFAAKWDAVPGDLKRSYRALAGIILVAVLLSLHQFGVLDLGLGDALNAQTIADTFAAWLAFVFGGEMNYQLFKPVLPRKKEDAA